MLDWRPRKAPIIPSPRWRSPGARTPPITDELSRLPVVEQRSRGSVRSACWSGGIDKHHYSLQPGVVHQRRHPREGSARRRTKPPQPSGYRRPWERRVTAEKLVSAKPREHDLDSILPHRAADSISIESVQRRLVHCCESIG